MQFAWPPAPQVHEAHWSCAIGLIWKALEYGFELNNRRPMSWSVGSPDTLWCAPWHEVSVIFHRTSQSWWLQIRAYFRSTVHCSIKFFISWAIIHLDRKRTSVRLWHRVHFRSHRAQWSLITWHFVFFESSVWPIGYMAEMGFELWKIDCISEWVLTFDRFNPHWAFCVGNRLKLTHWGCGYFLGRIYVVKPKLSRYSMGLR